MRRVVVAQVDDLVGVPLVAEDQDREEDRAPPASPRAGAAGAAAGSRRRRRRPRRERRPPARKSLKAARPVRGRSLACAVRTWRGGGTSCRRIVPGGTSVRSCAQQLHPQLVATRRARCRRRAAAVPVEGVEAVALEEAVAGEGDDDLAAGPDRPAPWRRRTGWSRKRIRDPVVAAVAVRREARTGASRAARADEGDPVDDQRVALQPLRLGEGGDGGDDEQREDDGAAGVNPPPRHCPRRRSPRRSAPRRRSAISALISCMFGIPSCLATVLRFRLVAALRTSRRCRRSWSSLLVTAPSFEALAFDLVAVGRGEAGDGGAVEHRHFDFARLRPWRPPPCLPLSCPCRCRRRRRRAPRRRRRRRPAADDEEHDQQRGSTSRSPKPEKPSRRRSPRVSSGRPSSRRWRRTSRLLDAPRARRSGDSSSCAQLLGPLGGDRRGRLLALGVALGRRAGPLAQAADVAACAKESSAKTAEARGRRPARRRRRFVSISFRLRRVEAARGYSSGARPVAASPPRARRSVSTDPLGQISLVPGQDQLLRARSASTSTHSGRAASSRTARMIRCEAVGCGFSSSLNSSSWSFSPGRGPVNSIAMSRLGLVAGEPDHVVGEVDDLHRLAHVEHEDLARRSPMSPARITSCTASGIVMK